MCWQDSILLLWPPLRVKSTERGQKIPRKTKIRQSSNETYIICVAYVNVEFLSGYIYKKLEDKGSVTYELELDH